MGRSLHYVPQPALPQVSAPTLRCAEIGMISILHTWGQNLLLHPHVHCVIPAGGTLPGSHQLGTSPLSFLSYR
jgi:hypothetical protein